MLEIASRTSEWAARQGTNTFLSIRIWRDGRPARPLRVIDDERPSGG